MKRTITGLAVAAVLAAGGSVVALAPAQADTPGCVSQSEFRHAKRHMAVRKVHRLFDTTGHREVISRGGGTVIEIRSYRACTRFGAVSVSYTNGKLSAKSGVF